MQRDRVPVLVDALVVLVVGASAIAQVWFATPPSLDGGRAVHTVLALGFSVPLLFRRSHPVTAMVTVASAMWLQIELGGAQVPTDSFEKLTTSG